MKSNSNPLIITRLRRDAVVPETTPGDKQIDRQTDTYKLTDRHTHTHTHRQSVRQTDFNWADLGLQSVADSVLYHFMQHEGQQEGVDVHPPTGGGSLCALHTVPALLDVHHCHISRSCV